MNKSKDIKQIDPYLKIGEEVTIIDRSQLLSITPEQAKKIKSLIIENQTIDNEFLLIWDKNFNKKEFDYLSFKHCCFPCVTGIFCGMLVHNLEVIDCGLDEDDVYDIIHGVNPYIINHLSLAMNSLSDPEGNIIDLFIRYVSGCWSASIDLSGNCFTDEFKSEVLQMSSLSFYF